MKTREQEIEQNLLKMLTELKYTYRGDIHDLAGLENNFREKFEELNQVHLTDQEFARLKDEIIKSDVFAAAKLLREYNSFEREDGTPFHYTLVNIKDWCKNTFEVVHQLRINTHSSNHRYDVFLLINGVPVVQIELKSFAISPRRAIEQIFDYKTDVGNGYTRTLLCFVQLFIVSNRSDTWYFTNNNARHFSFDANEKYLPVYQFADAENKKITALEQFADKFLAKCTLGQMISRYMVLVASEQKLLMMRPYQIYAVQAIVDCIHENRGNGYIWHTTGSGKTLTSFKAATLLKDNPDIHKCLFVVDRKDLDRQTVEEFNKFQEGCVETNTDTANLVRRLLSRDYADKVIVTTIQKLGRALSDNKKNFKEKLAPLQNKRIVFIFDECHRSQFGDNHEAIKEFFPHAQLFGFTGTPIFNENGSESAVRIVGTEKTMKTTALIFSKELHAYTIAHAIDDKSVLSFHIDYFGEKQKKQAPNTQISKRAIAKAIIEKHEAATSHRKFNALFATQSINDAIEYYKIFQTIQTENKLHNASYTELNIACVFSPPPGVAKTGTDLADDLDNERENNKEAPDQKKEALEKIISDYNARYGTNCRISEFDEYYKNVQGRIKDQQYPNKDIPHKKKIDITIVVDMLLTGFDSKYLNTLYVDKNSKQHGLIQAFSRTNRILNDSKPFGNVVCFDPEFRTIVDDAIKLFSGAKGDEGLRKWTVEPAPEAVKKFAAAKKALDDFMQQQSLESKPEQVANIRGDTARAEFVRLFKDVQKLSVQLAQYTDIEESDKVLVEKILPTDDLLAFRAAYIETAKKIRKENSKKDKDQAPTEQQELDFEFVLFSSTIIDYDYIMKLLSEMRPSDKHYEQDKKQLLALIASDSKFNEDREDLTEYINTLQKGEALSEAAIRAGFSAFKKEKEDRAIASIAGKYKIAQAELKKFVEGIIELKVFDGEELTDLLAPLDLGWKERSKIEQALMHDLIPLLKKLAGGQEISGLNSYE